MPLMPGPVADERDGLLSFLDASRRALKASVFELSREQATSTPSVSALNLAGLIKHVASTELYWVSHLLGGRPLPEIDYDGGFALKDDESVEGTIAFYEDVAATTEQVVRALPDMDVPVPVPQGVPWFPKDVDAWSARWVLLHVIEETARHSGHADIIRESIDGVNAFVNQMRAEGETPAWLDEVNA